MTETTGQGTKEGKQEVTFWDYFKKRDPNEESLPAPEPVKRWGRAVVFGTLGGMLFGGALGISRARKLNAVQQEMKEQQEKNKKASWRKPGVQSLDAGIRGIGGPKGSGRAAAAYPALFSRFALSYGGRFALFTAIFSATQETVAHFLTSLIPTDKREIEQEGKQSDEQWSMVAFGEKLQSHEHPVALTGAGAVTAFLFRPAASVRVAVVSAAIGGGLGLSFALLNINLKKLNAKYAATIQETGTSASSEGLSKATADDIDKKIEDTVRAIQSNAERLRTLQQSEASDIKERPS